MNKPDHAKDTAKFVADLIRHGHAVELVAVEVVRTGPWSCAKCNPAKAVQP
jgi:hypothetical protein